MKEVTTNSAEETRKLGSEIASKLKGGEALCLRGDLGSGKTTFSQGLLEGLGAEKPYTSPTFVVMKKYDLNVRNIKNSYHIDTYRVGEEDILDLGWEELINSDKNIIIVEWPERISKIIPKSAININFESIDENRKVISFPEL